MFSKIREGVGSHLCEPVFSHAAKNLGLLTDLPGLCCHGKCHGTISKVGRASVYKLGYVIQKGVKQRTMLPFWRLLKGKKCAQTWYADKVNPAQVKQSTLLCCFLHWWDLTCCQHTCPPMGIFHPPVKHVLLVSCSVCWVERVYPPELHPSPKTPCWQVRRSGSPGQQ